MRRQLPGGVSPFETSPRPSIFNRLPPDEIYDRLGERVIFLRNVPTPDVTPGRYTTPDAESDSKGYVYGYQYSLRIPEEVLQLQPREGNRYYTQFAPIHKVHDLYVFRNELQGGNIRPEIASIGPDYLELVPHPEVEYYHELRLDYESTLVESADFELVLAAAGTALDLSSHDALITDRHGRIINVCIGVESVELLPAAPAEPVVLQDWTHDFTRIQLAESYPAGTRFRARIRYYETIPVAYRTINPRRMQDQKVEFDLGDLEVVVSPWYKLSEGDLLIFTNSFQVRKEVCRRIGDRYRLSNSPVVEIEGIFVLNAEGVTIEIPPEQGRIEEFHWLRLPPEIAAETISVVYSFHPQYRVRPQLEYSALAGRQQPRRFWLSPAQTALILS